MRRRKQKPLYLPMYVFEADDDTEFDGTILDIHATIRRYVRKRYITRKSHVYIHDADYEVTECNYGHKYPGTVGDLLDDLDRYIGEGHAASWWQIDRDDGWHDRVVSVGAW